MIPYYQRNLYILSTTIFLVSLSWNQVIPFLPKFLESMGVGNNIDWWVAAVFGLQSAAAMVCLPFWGKLGDTHGRKIMIIRAGIFLSLIYFAMSFSVAPWQVALCRFLNGALTGFIPGSFALIATNTPEEVAPRSVATAQMASSAGLLLGPVIGGFLADIFGYRGSMVISGSIVFISTLTVWGLVQEPNKVKPTDKTSLWQDVKTAIRSKVMRSLLFAVFVAWMFGAAIGPFLALYLPTLQPGLKAWLIGLVISLPSLALFLTARLWTRIGERYGYDRIIVIGLVGSGCMGLTAFFVHTYLLFAVFFFIGGVFMAALPPAVGAITCTRIEESFRGRAYGLQQAAGTSAALIAPVGASFVSHFFGRAAIFPAAGLVTLTGAYIVWRQLKQWEPETTITNRAK